jgi:hypothetical protein
MRQEHVNRWNYKLDSQALESNTHLSNLGIIKQEKMTKNSYVRKMELKLDCHRELDVLWKLQMCISKPRST